MPSSLAKLCMNYSSKIGVLVSLFLIGSCSSNSPEVSLPPERISLIGFSLLPINEEGWSVKVKTFDMVILRKMVDDGTYVVIAILTPLSKYQTEEEFLARVKESQALYLDMKQFTVRHNETRTFKAKGTTCARSNVILQEKSTVKFWKTEPAYLEIVSFLCVHPQNVGIAAMVNYSQRYFVGQRDTELFKKAEMVFNSVEFNELDFKRHNDVFNRTR